MSALRGLGTMRKNSNHKDVCFKLGSSLRDALEAISWVAGLKDLGLGGHPRNPHWPGVARRWFISSATASGSNPLPHKLKYQVNHGQDVRE